MASKPVFEFFDSNSDPTTTSTTAAATYAMQAPERDYDEHDLLSTSSTTSINSLFDLTSALHARSTSSTTVTPALSRNDSMKLTKKQPNQVWDFASKLDKRLKQAQSPPSLLQPSPPQQKTKLVFLLVGLPASGKSTLCHHFKDYIDENTSYRAQIYNAGNVRRRKSLGIFNDSTFFDPRNNQAKQDRELYATITLNNLLADVANDVIDIGFLDATNTTQTRRHRMLDSIHNANSQYTLRAIILDVQCFDANLVNFNICRGKVHNQDYANKNSQVAIRDFKKRLAHYKQVYEPVEWSELDEYDLMGWICGYAKFIDAGRQFVLQPSKSGENEGEREEQGEDVGEDDDDDDAWYWNLIESFRARYWDLKGKVYHEDVQTWYQEQGKGLLQ
ncbi:uncharacterized protein LODBEIA_P03360 [Lodderomyces beijingensis]|uniref:6-phosphofructo-2-kinase domain-containing protein n=1 Tax=Lodderomyces beijingensis TaxID=1775926 RepID=A0ABP0ZF81_9ASCO